MNGNNIMVWHGERYSFCFIKKIGIFYKNIQRILTVFDYYDTLLLLKLKKNNGSEKYAWYNFDQLAGMDFGDIDVCGICTYDRWFCTQKEVL